MVAFDRAFEKFASRGLSRPHSRKMQAYLFEDFAYWNHYRRTVRSDLRLFPPGAAATAKAEGKGLYNMLMVSSQGYADACNGRISDSDENSVTLSHHEIEGRNKFEIKTRVELDTIREVVLYSCE